MPPHPHGVPLRAFQRPGFHLGSETAALDALRSARPPPEEVLGNETEGAPSSTRMLPKRR